MIESTGARNAPASARGKGRGKKAFDLSGNGDYDDIETDVSESANMTNGILNENDSTLLTPEDQPMSDSVLDQDAGGPDQTEEPVQNFEADDSELMGPPAVSGDMKLGKKRGRAPRSRIANHDESTIPTQPMDQPRRGRPPKKTQVYQDADVNPPIPASPARNGKRLPPPSLRDPNVRRKVPTNAHSKPPSRAGSVAGGPRFIQRSETPANDSGALITRFGRQSIKPLASWRGEKTVMGDRTFDTLPGIKEVIRVDEVVEPRPKQRHRKNTNRARPRLADVEEEFEDDRAPWELDPGIMVAQVMDWDANTNKYDEESTREEGAHWPPVLALNIYFLLTSVDIAYSFEAIEMRDIKGAEFKFAKTLTLDFFGSGMVQLPPGGAKRIKNSRKMQMVFFVFYGRVTVSIGTPPTKFSIGKGGQWQVPRGKSLSLFVLAALSTQHSQH